MGLSVATLALAKKYTDEQIDNVSSSISPDWNQNEETAPDYIKNKPTIPSKTSDLINDSGFLNEKPTYTAAEVGADAKGSSASALADAKSYTDSAVANKAQVQIIKWEADD